MSDDDRTQEQIQPVYLEPIDAYNRALVQFDHQLAVLSSALCWTTSNGLGDTT